MGYNRPIQVVDPEVTRVKFDEQISRFRAVEAIYRAKGIICTSVTYPCAQFIFGIPKIIPSPIVFSVEINFLNFDAEPPSLVFIDPFTGSIQHKREQIPIAFIQVNKNMQAQDLVQGVGEIVPFLCIPGIKEYHDHAAHSGDSWLLYRTLGEGNLLFILDQLYNHSIAYATGYLVNFVTSNVNINQEIVFQKPIKLTKL